jgi:mannose-6-phosphate isomerase-like protein (cupin superfamily)
MSAHWTTRCLPAEFDDVAADGSQVRQLLTLAGCSTVHCTLPPDPATPTRASHATVNIGIDEIWYFLDGQGELWRKNDEVSETVPVNPGVTVTIPAGTVFQFRNSGQRPLVFLCITSPPWRRGTNVKVDEYRWPPGLGGQSDLLHR